LPDDRDALARVAYAEAGNQGTKGLVAVVFTVLNRVRSGKFQDSVQAVIGAPNQFEPVARAGGWRNLPALSIGLQAQFDAVLEKIQSGQLSDPTRGALYFQNRAIVAARAAAGLVPASLIDFGGRSAVAEIGDHHFYAEGPRAGGRRGTAPLSAASGWAVVLGAFPQDFRAQRAIELAKAGLGIPEDIGQPNAVLLRDGKFYAALLVGLKEDVAESVCLSLRRGGAYCIKLTPAQLNDPSADWRG
jgi:hypothetical protein